MILQFVIRTKSGILFRELLNVPTSYIVGTAFQSRRIVIVLFTRSFLGTLFVLIDVLLLVIVIKLYNVSRLRLELRIDNIGRHFPPFRKKSNLNVFVNISVLIDEQLLNRYLTLFKQVTELLL